MKTFLSILNVNKLIGLNEILVYVTMKHETNGFIETYT